MYMAMGNDPISKVDPSGFAACPVGDQNCFEDAKTEKGNEQQSPPSSDQAKVDEVVVTGYRDKKFSNGEKIRFPSGGIDEQGFKADKNAITPIPFSKKGTQNCDDGTERAANSINISALGGASIGHTHGGGDLDPLPGPEDGVAAGATANTAYMISRAGAFAIESTGVGFRVRQLAGKSLTSSQKAQIESTISGYNKHGGGSGVKCKFTPN